MVGDQRLEVVSLEAAVPGAILKVKEFRGETYLCTSVDRLRDVLQVLRDHPDLQYNYFSECLGVDYSRWEHERDLEGRFEIVYNLMSLKHYSRIFVKIAVDDGETVPTVRDIYEGAEYPEREIQDLFGIFFEGNGPTKGQRFLLPDDWVGFPLRKEYPLGGDDVIFDGGDRGPAIEDLMMPHAGESFEGRTGSEDVSGR
ncbi:MAG: NADH-quinone oxidoreductase subunit C [Fimbriimonas sp.]